MLGLAKIGSISGTITKKSDMIEISTYAVKNIPGNYFVKVRTAGSGYRTKYYNDALTVDTAALISIIDGQTRMLWHWLIISSSAQRHDNNFFIHPNKAGSELCPFCCHGHIYEATTYF